jgi:acyl-CoA synthetase (AMP-forming)/AMP-acid ligase II/3-hydroxymyristoyl/3-hydroxydecanoyl-(acyl carrier protein) dehydratase
MTLANCLVSDGCDPIVCYADGACIHQSRFCEDIQQLYNAVQLQKNNDFALYFEDGYRFAVHWFALLHARKNLLIAANNTATAANSLTDLGYTLLGHWQGREDPLQPQDALQAEMNPIDLASQCIYLFTSGSQGEPKLVKKTLQQLQTEIATLENLWGDTLADSAILATVSHQHIYGLLFKVLWPVVTHRIFYSVSFLSPEPLLKAVHDKPAVWIASPAQLKRLDAQSPWSQLARLNAIFSSGGLLPASSSENIWHRTQRPVIEVYGSTETGGIGWRKLTTDTLWRVFPGIHIKQTDDQQFWLYSPYLPDSQPVRLDDRLNLHPDGQFELLGRQDRIVKLEEKRLSLSELENCLVQSPWVAETFAQIIHRERDLLCVTMVLTEAGQVALQTQQRKALVRQLKTTLLQSFEPVVIPKRWIFVNTLPQTPQGKIDAKRLSQLYALPKTHFPLLYGFNHQQETLELELYIAPQLIFFQGHFPEQPVLPGVAQIYLVENYASLFFTMDKAFHAIELIKFSKIIVPHQILILKLNWKSSIGKLYFQFYTEQTIYSSGRLTYR